MKKFTIPAIVVIGIVLLQACQKEELPEPISSPVDTIQGPRKIKSYSLIGYDGLTEYFFWEGDKRSMKTHRLPIIINHGFHGYSYDTTFFKDDRMFRSVRWDEDTSVFERYFYYSDTNVIRITNYFEDNLRDSAIYILENNKPVRFDLYSDGQLLATEDILWDADNYYGDYLESYEYDTKINPFYDWNIISSKNNPTHHAYFDGWRYDYTYTYEGEYPSVLNVDVYYKEEYKGYQRYRYLYY